MNEKDVIIACDFSSAEETLTFLDRFGGKKPYVKIGMELYYAAGPDMVRRILERGHRVFLDLKLHDIPNTVRKAMKNLARLGVHMTNLHAAGGRKMMQAAVEGLAEGAAEAKCARPLLIAVTQLPSTRAEMLRDELLIGTPMEETVAHYAANAAQSGLDGVVCSPHEAAAVKRANGQGFLTVTPGIRFADGSADDQVRIMTPEKARATGTDYIVVGRAVTAAADPQGAYLRCLEAFTGGMNL